MSSAYSASSDLYAKKTGWIPYDDRTQEQKVLTHEFHSRIGIYGAEYLDAELPVQAYLPLLELKHLGKLLFRVFQQSGSCVGAAADRAYKHATLGDKDRGDLEELKTLFPFATYGVGRRKAGMNRPGEGSFGGAQAWAAEHFGVLALDSALGLPQPETRYRNWLIWPARTEIQWSHPSSWPIDEARVTEEANTNQVRTVTQVKSRQQLKTGLAQGYGATMASMFGSRNMRVKGSGDNAILMAEWNTTWPHQMGIDGYWINPDVGETYQIANQWSPSAHPECPFQSKHGVLGSFSIAAGTMDRIIGGGEVYLHSNTEGFPTRQLD